MGLFQLLTGVSLDCNTRRKTIPSREDDPSSSLVPLRGGKTAHEYRQLQPQEEGQPLHPVHLDFETLHPPDFDERRRKDLYRQFQRQKEGQPFSSL